jgi:type VI secretion system protein ImpH
MSEFSSNSATLLAEEPASALPSGVRSGTALAKQALSVSQRLFESAPEFDFFQAVSLLEACTPGKKPVGFDSLPNMEAIRFRVLPSNSFPASAIHEIDSPDRETDQSVMTVTFFGLVGLNGALPRHYTDALLRGLREGKGREKKALLEWLDIFHHRLISLFHRAWAKYRFPIGYARREYLDDEPDTFTQAMYSLIGMGMPTLRKRLNVRRAPKQTELLISNRTGNLQDLLQRSCESERLAGAGERLAEISDLALLRYAGLLTQRPRCVANLQRLISDFFRLPVEVHQFQGQWLSLNPRNQTRLGVAGGATGLGQDAVVGARVWSVESKIRLRLGPLSYQQFSELLPDSSVTPHRKAFFLLNQLVRLFLGPEIDFDVQLVLHADDVPSTQLTPAEDQGPRLGWNCWLLGEDTKENADDAVFVEGLFPCHENLIAI